MRTKAFLYSLTGVSANTRQRRCSEIGNSDCRRFKLGRADASGGLGATGNCLPHSIFYVVTKACVLKKVSKKHLLKEKRERET